MRNYAQRLGQRLGATRMVQIAIGLVVVEIVLVLVTLTTGNRWWLLP